MTCNHILVGSMMDNLINITEAAKQLGVSVDCLRKWDKSGKLIALRTSGGHRRYKQSDISKLQGIEIEETNQDITAIYCRVSSQDQKKNGDLDRQKARLFEHCTKQKYKVEYCFDEVCSGMKAVRPKLKQLFKLIEEKKVNRVVIEHKDRLTRFMFEIFAQYFQSHGVEVECVEEVLPKNFENELVEDILSLLSSFSSRIYGKRSAERRKKKKDKESD